MAGEEGVMLGGCGCSRGLSHAAGDPAVVLRACGGRRIPSPLWGEG